MISLPVVSSPLQLDELLSSALAASVASAGAPFSRIEIDSVDQPVPARWQSDVPIEGGVFSKGPPANLPVGPPSLSWNGPKAFESALNRLSLTRDKLNQLETDAQLIAAFGKDNMHRMKKTVKNELKEYDAEFKAATGKDASRADKEPMRLLYTLYRRLRELAENPTSVLPSGLTDRLEALYLEKQTVRSVLQEYQARFLSEQGRRIKYHRDIVSVDREYRQYKQVKEEIAKLEVQLGRRPLDDDDTI